MRLRAAFVLIVVACVAGVSCRPPAPARAAPASPARDQPNRFSVDPAAVGDPQLLARLRETPHAYFRFLNAPWTQAVCDAFTGEAPALATVRLHGDAHVEQYAVTATAYGLDDFDDSAKGPAVVDAVRFLGSLELVAIQRGWGRDVDLAHQAFFRGYRRALANPEADRPSPAVVKRLRRRPVRDQRAFLAWAESLIRPGPPGFPERFERGMAVFRQAAVEQAPELDQAFLHVKRSGVLQMGIGSALARKVLLRVEGPTPSPDDDEILEAKEVSRLREASCVSVERSAEVYRVVTGASQLGRLSHRVLLVVPILFDNQSDAAGWWVRSWDRSYREVEISDLKSSRELAELAEDAGTQLGAANTREGTAEEIAALRQLELDALPRVEARIRDFARRLTADLLAAWRAFRAGTHS